MNLGNALSLDCNHDSALYVYVSLMIVVSTKQVLGQLHDQDQEILYKSGALQQVYGSYKHVGLSAGILFMLFAFKRSHCVISKVVGSGSCDTSAQHQ